MTLVVSATVGSAGQDVAGQRAGGTVQPVAGHQRAEGNVRAEEGARVREGGKPRLEVPETYFLAPASAWGGKGDPRPSQKDLDVEIHDLGNGNRERPSGRLTLDASDLSGKVAFRQDGLDKCEGYGSARIDCSVSSSLPVFKTYLRALDAGRNGDSGTLRYTFTPRQGEPRTATTRVVIGRPRLAVEQPPMRKGVKPTESVRVPITFKNVGEVPARGVVASVRQGATEEQHRNCRYRAVSVTCQFPDVVVRPGETMTLAPALSVRNPEPAMYESIPFSVRPMEKSDDPGPGEPGRGSPLRLTDTDAKGPFREFDEPGGEALMYLRRPTRADYEATGVRLSEESDDRVRVRVGVRNNGPAGDPGPGGPYHAKVTFPPGSTVLRTPRDEDLEENAELCQRVSGTEYRCAVSPDRGRTTTFDFVLRPGWWGQTRVEVTDSERFPRLDPRPANDTAAASTPAGTLHKTLSVTVGLVVVAGALTLTRRRWMTPLRRLVARSRHRP
ncbi:hypothetical protein E0L36_20915 [Streptomyces sp. AJS327]|uniref:hypothetical protein n=1 Tax=Streptomyces sp. AJS327 TaxID=2545265 RepID=UPI0015DDBE2E|nr:hypothetical protein [Streptomyces sp. AJS327]MBA0053244.1 hypothetical protein [Streptomyces sp. AJS327]